MSSQLNRTPPRTRSQLASDPSPSSLSRSSWQASSSADFSSPSSVDEFSGPVTPASTSSESLSTPPTSGRPSILTKSESFPTNVEPTGISSVRSGFVRDPDLRSPELAGSPFARNSLGYRKKTLGSPLGPSSSTGNGTTGRGAASGRTLFGTNPSELDHDNTKAIRDEQTELLGSEGQFRREAQGTGINRFTEPLEKRSTDLELDSKNAAINEPVPSATQTEKSSFLWVPLNHDTVPATTNSSGSDQGKGKPLRYVAPETSYFEKIISPRRDPYLAALDAASGRSFSDRLPPIKNLRMNGEKPKHGLPRPPGSSKQSTRISYGTKQPVDPKPQFKVNMVEEAAPPPPPLLPPVDAETQIAEIEGNGEEEEQLQPREESKEITGMSEGESDSKATVLEESKEAPEVDVEQARPKPLPIIKPHLEPQPTMPCHHRVHAEPPKRRTLSFTPSRFKPGPPSALPRTFTRAFRRQGTTPRTPRTPLTPSAPGTYDMFKTRSRKFSGPLERQFSRRVPECNIAEDEEQGRCEDANREEEEENEMKKSLSAHRYFDALQGPELEDPKDKENLLLPPDERWPFLLRFPIGCFGVALGLGSQTILWKNLAQIKEMEFLHIPIWINMVLWCVASLALTLIFITYFLKIIYYFEAVRREYHHPVRVNFFFAPWIAGMFLALGCPPAISKSVHPAVWCVLMSPILMLELKIYGQWLSGGERRLSKVANPSTHLSVVGNFVGSLLGATVGWKEPAIFFWAVGLAHYLVLFVTLYQRLPTNETLPKDLHPVFFLFVAAPSAASVAWMKITGTFDYVSRLVFFIALFLYSSLIVRINFFRGFKFSISWWAYTFPMTAASIASIQYSHVAPSVITRALALALSFVASATVLTLFCSTLLHAFVWHTLFPNDLAIAITAYKPKYYTPKPEDDDGCGLASLHHSEPLYKSMMDAYHHFLSTREQQELRHCKTEPPNPRASLSPESTNGSSHPDSKQTRSTSL